MSDAATVTPGQPRPGKGTPTPAQATHVVAGVRDAAADVIGAQLETIGHLRARLEATVAERDELADLLAQRDAADQGRTGGG